jgi:hypothetical protein
VERVPSSWHTRDSAAAAQEAYGWAGGRGGGSSAAAAQAAYERAPPPALLSVRQQQAALAGTPAAAGSLRPHTAGSLSFFKAVLHAHSRLRTRTYALTPIAGGAAGGGGGGIQPFQSGSADSALQHQPPPSKVSCIHTHAYIHTYMRMLFSISLRLARCHAYIRMHTYACIHAYAVQHQPPPSKVSCIHTHAYIRMHTYIHTCVCGYTCVCCSASTSTVQGVIHTYAYEYVCMYHTYGWMDGWMDGSIYIHTYIHI